ncbi:hypothetical protein FPV67DRAFT_1469408 [Lyophyllum atratum]|nr:hypothetical protein FPV67DRAFT_1469408 [Lyophyllum atratum]
MFNQPIAISVTSHDCWPDSARVLRDEALLTVTDIPSEIMERLKFMAEEISTELNFALSMERKFGEQNDKTMYLAPFFAKLVHVAAPEVELEQLSYYPLAMDPCSAGDDLLDLLPQYGHATALMCTPMTLIDGSTSTDCTSSSPSVDSVEMTDHSASGSSTNSQSEGTHDEGSASEGDLESSETSAEVQHKKDYPNWDVDAREYFSGEHLEDGTEWSFYHDPRGATADDTLHPQSGVLDHRLLARLTLDLTEETTPLALICLAQESEIYSAMSSALFQRRAWGVVGPMMGVTFDRMGTTVRIVFGWLEETNDSCGVCRLPQILRGCIHDHQSVVHVLHEAAGAYDLSDPEAANDFAVLIGGEARRFAVDRQRASEHYPQLLQDVSERNLKLWRIDQKDLALKFERAEDVPAGSRLQRWLISADPLGTFPDGSTEEVMLSNASPASSPGSTALDEATHISASTLAAGGTHADKLYLMRYFMLDRLAMTRTLPVFSMLSDSKYNIEPEFAKICVGYYKLTGFTWLSDKVLRSPLGASVQKCPIFRQAAHTLAGLQSLSRIGRFPAVDKLSDVCSEILARNLRAIQDVLQSVVQLRGHGWKQAKELECRIHFDRLLMLLFHGKADGTADVLLEEDYSKCPHVMASLERNLVLPRGDVSEAVSSLWNDKASKARKEIEKINEEIKKVLSAEEDMFENFEEEIQAHVAEESTLQPSSDEYKEKRAQQSMKEDTKLLLSYLLSASVAHGYFSLDTGAHIEDIVHNYNNEPDRAICDSIAYLRIPAIFSSIDASEAFNMIRPPTPSPQSRSSVRTNSENPPPRHDSSFGVRQEQMVRKFDPKNSVDIYATAQDQAVVVEALLEVCQPLSTAGEDDDSGLEFPHKRSLNPPVQTGGTSTSHNNVLDMRKDLFLPLLISENRKSKGSFVETGVNLGRMHAISSTKFYAALGVYGVPIYVIITEGPVAVITVTYGEEWKDHPFDPKKYEARDQPNSKTVPKKDDLPGSPPKPTKVHIIERNVISYDISKPMGILNFATLLIRLRIEHVPNVLAKLGDHIQEYVREQGIPLDGQPPKASWQNTRTVVAK